MTGILALIAVVVGTSCTPTDAGAVTSFQAPNSVVTPVPVSAPWPLEGHAVTVESAHGMVVSGHPIASEVGAEILERGGNAADAAVAVGFALAVVLPEAGNLGGGGFLVFRSAGGEVRSLDFRETAPGRSSRDMFVGADGTPTGQSLIGHLATGVPGTVAGLFEMHTELGSLSWSDLVQPAIDLARSHVIDAARSRSIESSAPLLRSFPESANQFLPGDEPPPAGSDWTQPELAATLEAIRDGGAESFYTGAIADLLVAEMERGGGIIDHADLVGYNPVWRDPVVAEYRDFTVYSMPPPSSGGLTLALILNILEGYDPMPAFASPDLLHLEAEAMRRAFVDRNRHLGDPDFVLAPLAKLQSQAYADSLRATIDLHQATPTGSVAGLGEGSETTHYSVVDSAGNAAGVTTSLNSSYGSGVTVTGAGFLLNNHMDDFATAPGRPNQFGLVQGEQNAIEPGKRMLSSMSPSIVTDPNGELFLVVGSPGGPTIITSVLQVISNLIDHRMDLASAVESPRVHHQALPDALYFEPDGLAGETAGALRSRGHVVQQRDGYLGNISAIVRVAGAWQGVADPRGDGGAAAADETAAGAVRWVSRTTKLSTWAA